MLVLLIAYHYTSYATESEHFCATSVSLQFLCLWACTTCKWSCQILRSASFILCHSSDGMFICHKFYATFTVFICFRFHVNCKYLHCFDTNGWASVWYCFTKAGLWNHICSIFWDFVHINTYLVYVKTLWVCLSSDTDGASIYYTLNGTKPAPFQTIGAAAKSTILYQEPFVLPPGKRTIKALAVTRLDNSASVDTEMWMKVFVKIFVE